MDTYPGSRRSSSAREALDSSGMESIPVVLMLGVLGAALTLGIMVSGIDMAQRERDRLSAISGFDEFVSRVSLLCSGGEGSSAVCELEIGGGKVEVEGRKLKLVLDGEEMRSALIPVPFEPPARELRGGVYLITLVSQGGEEMIRLEEHGEGKR